MKKKNKQIIKGETPLEKQFGVREDEVKNAIIAIQDNRVSLDVIKKNDALLEDIIEKVKRVVASMDDEKINKATISNLGSTLKSLVQAYHFLSLTFTPQKNEGEQIVYDAVREEDPEKLLEKANEIVLRTRTRWIKNK
jgi:hypothetical protein